MTIKLPPELESKLKAAASARGVDANEYAVKLMDEVLSKEDPDDELAAPDEGTLALLDRWDQRDASDDPAAVQQAIRDAEAFMQNLDRNRREMEGPNARRLWP
jgi:hypothetical protein